MKVAIKRWRAGDRLSSTALATPIGVVVSLLAVGGILLGFGYSLEAGLSVMLSFAYCAGWIGFRGEVREKGGQFPSPTPYTYFSPRGANELVAIAEMAGVDRPLEAHPHPGPPVFLRVMFTGSRRNPVPDHRCRSLIRAGVPDVRETRTAYGAVGCFLLLDKDLSARERHRLCEYLLKYLDTCREAGDQGVFSEGTRWATIQLCHRVTSENPEKFSEECRNRFRHEYLLTLFDGTPSRAVRTSPDIHFPRPSRFV